MTLQTLPADEGGGFLALVPDLPGCMSGDGSPELTVANVRDAIAPGIGAAGDLEHKSPAPWRDLLWDAAQ